jgi:cell division protein FtsQ
VEVEDSKVDRSFAARPGSLRWAPSLGRLSWSFALPRRGLAKWLCIALAALLLLGGGWLWLRSSPLVAVQRVQISGVHGAEAAEIETALGGAARRMTTLDVNVATLRAAVAAFPVVRDLSVSASFPHGLRIRVIEQPPVAVLTVGGARTAVAADGVVLGPALLTDLRSVGSLPAITLAGAPLRTGSRVQDATTRAELSVLGAAPRALLRWVARVYMSGREGLTVAMSNGLTIYFGDATRPHAKWLSAARVLADPSSAGATYVDVRAPERPAAGTTAAGGLEGGSTPAQVSASDPTSAAIANVLAEAVTGGSSTASPSAGSVAAVPSSAGSSAAGTAGATEASTPAATGTAGSEANNPASTGTAGSTEASTPAPTGTPAAGTSPTAPAGAPTGTESSNPEPSSSTSG